MSVTRRVPGQVMLKLVLFPQILMNSCDAEERELSYSSLCCVDACVILKKDKGPIRL